MIDVSRLIDPIEALPLAILKMKGSSGHFEEELRRKMNQ